MDIEVLRQALMISSANNCALQDWGTQSMAWAQDDMAIVGAMADDCGISLPQAVRLASLHPAEAVGLGDRGEIAANRRADLVRVRLHDTAPMVRAVWREGERVV